MQKRNRKQAPKNAGRYKKSIITRCAWSLLLVLLAVYTQRNSPETFERIQQKATVATDFTKIVEKFIP